MLSKHENSHDVPTDLQVINNVEPVIEQSLVVEVEPHGFSVVEVLVDGPAPVVCPNVHEPGVVVVKQPGEHALGGGGGLGQEAGGARGGVTEQAWL